MTTPTQDDDTPNETPGGSTISDPDVFNDPGDTDVDDIGDHPVDTIE